MAFVVDSELLIAEVEKYPCLWNTRLADYLDRNVRARAWRKVAGVLKPDLRDFERVSYIREIQRRWKCIRDACLKSLKRPRHLVGRKKQRRMKPYVYMNQLTFILPFLELQKSPTDYEDDDSSMIYPKEFQYPESDTEDFPPPSNRKRRRKKKKDPGSSDNSLQHYLVDPETQFSFSDSFCEPKYTETSHQPYILDLRENGCTTTSSPANDAASQHRFDLLGKNWSEKMKTLPNDQRIFAEKLINDVFYEAELNRLGNGCRLVVSS